jgi:hypothetical protein
MSSRSRRKHERLSPPDPATVDRYEPDYAQSCETCGESPTVTGLRNGVVVVDTGLCGSCCWGDARAFDPCTWNE